MALAVRKKLSQNASSSKSCSRNAKPSTSYSPSSWGRMGVRILMHRDLLTCRFFRSLPRSWLKKFWGRQQSNKHHSTSSSFSSSHSQHWSSSHYCISSPCCSSSSCVLSSSPVFHFCTPAIKDRDRERESSSSQALDGHPSGSSVPGMTIFPRGPNASPAAAHSSSTATASSAGHRLRHHSSSGSVPLTGKCHFTAL